jgi:DNA polymerase III subunit epsilon
MILFFDTETNGLWRRDLEVIHLEQPRLVSLALMICKDDETPISQISLRAKPDNWSIPKGASDVNGITTEEATNTGISTHSIMCVLSELLNQCHTLVAHNAAFDLQIIEREFYKQDIKFKLPENIHCSMMMAKDELKLEGKFKDYKFPKLQETFEAFFHSSPQQYHDALLDVQLCKEIYFHLLRKGVEPKGPQDIPKELLVRLEGESYDKFVIFLNGLNPKKLNQWELDFGNSMKERLSKFDNHFLLSKKQLEILRKLYAKNDQND